MHVLTIVIMLVLIAVAGLLLIPFHLKLEALKDCSSLRGSYRISWAGLTIKQGEIPPEEKGEIVPEETVAEKPEESPDKEKEESRQSRRETSRFDMPADPQLFIDALPDMIHSVKGLIRSISVEKFRCRLAMGLADPADTAVAFGLIWSITSAIGGFRKESIYLEPHFEGEKLDGSVTADLKVRLASIFAVFIKSLEKKPIRKLVAAVMGGQIEDKRSRTES
jgi:hypothetical protein